MQNRKQCQSSKDAVVGQELLVFQQPGNPHDRRAVAIYSDAHAPRQLKFFFWFSYSMMARQAVRSLEGGRRAKVWRSHAFTSLEVLSHT